MAVVEGSTLTAQQRIDLLTGESLHVDAELWLLDSSDVLIEDVTADFQAEGSSIERSMYATIHGTATLRVSRALQWGSQRLAPKLLLSSNGSDWYRWSMGVFVPSVPTRQLGDTPVTYDVDCMDKLDILNTPHGSTYSLDAGDPILAAVAALITGAGETKINIDQTASATVAASQMTFSLLEEQFTTLGICNKLLDAVGYRGLWCDPDGYYRSAPYRAPSELGSVFALSADSATTTVGQYRTYESDYWQAANVVVGINDDLGDAIPVAGNGIYTATNQADGPTSINARGGRTIRRIVSGTYADQAALVVATDGALDTEKRVANTVELTVSPNPLLRTHFSVVGFRDDAVPVNGNHLITAWSCPLDGSDMSVSLRAV